MAHAVSFAFPDRALGTSTPANTKHPHALRAIYAIGSGSPILDLSFCGNHRRAVARVRRRRAPVRRSPKIMPDPVSPARHKARFRDPPECGESVTFTRHRARDAGPRIFRRLARFLGLAERSAAECLGVVEDFGFRFHSSTP